MKHNQPPAGQWLPTYKLLVRTPKSNSLRKNPEGMLFFPFCRPCPVECEAYSTGVSRKEKEK
jgi:hypothetical protein